MKDTVVVAVTRLKPHPKYKKIIKSTQKYKAHYSGGDINCGDRVVIEESRPISKTKRWVIKSIEKKVEKKMTQDQPENNQ